MPFYSLHTRRLSGFMSVTDYDGKCNIKIYCPVYGGRMHFDREPSNILRYSELV